jgi:hypothetical protein
MFSVGLDLCLVLGGGSQKQSRRRKEASKKIKNGKKQRGKLLRVEER